MADYTPACPTCGATIKDVKDNLKVLDSLLMAQNGKYYSQQWYEDLLDGGAESKFSHPTLGEITVHYVTEKEPDSYGDYIDGDGHLVFEVQGMFLKKEFSYNSYGTTTWSDDAPRKVSKTAKTVTVYSYE